MRCPLLLCVGLAGAFVAPRAPLRCWHATVARNGRELDDLIDDAPRVGFSRELEDPTAAAPGTPKPGAEVGTINRRMLEEWQELTAKIPDSPRADQQTIARENTDLNGIQPLVPLVSAVLVAAASWFLWQFTTFAAESFATSPIEMDFYPAQRLAGFIRQSVIALLGLASSITALTAAGLLGLGLRVGAGTLTGELDPTAEATQERRTRPNGVDPRAIFEKASEIFNRR